MTEAIEAPPRRWVRWMLGALCVLMAAMWFYAFVLADDTGAYRVQDDQWRTAAREVCRAANAERVKLADTAEGYIAHPTNEQMLERADVVDKATDILERMLDDVVALPVATPRDRELIDVWAKYYRILIGDRRTYTANLRAFDLQPYHESSEAGGPVTNIITDFTSGNDIKTCVPPGELGGDT